MSDNGNHPETRVAQAGRRVRGSGPILIVAVLFVAATFLAWYFTWFGRELSEADISRYLSDEQSPRHVQHALLQIQQRMERGDPGVKQWYPRLMMLSRSPETEFRLTVAWLMGFDTSSNEFQGALAELLHDREPIVRRNAALALVRFGDRSGREELMSVLKPYGVKATTDGVVASTLHEGSGVARTSLLARIQRPDGKVVEVRSPLAGKIDRIGKGNGAQVSEGEEILSIHSDEESVWEALRGLSLIGEPRDLAQIQGYASGKTNSARIREQASLTAKAIEGRASQNR